ncbi:type VI secretion system membrane subunit TssM [Propylenella binzhouense]|uniref:Type VI secretion system membrane subunit TssM n=1 Tax=Propylenella binzhouense TaxID=2555902 RepID=A0A964WVP9_9HYPH|nr:type VI secretion system membrane subunit TssM [Propylenella binzhouense]MYZ50269.1 type VI secretion system membrane subunit TssM [Propylenella binzhouense]
MRKWVARAAILLGLLAFALVVWFAGPLIGFAGVRLFEPVWVRLAIIGVAFAIAAIVFGIRYWRRRKAERALEAALVDQEAEDGDGKILGERMQEALATLKRSSGRSSYLYELPWYVIIGPPGAGKTTALVNSGLKFPLAGGNPAAAIAGVGGTRYCDWWFTEEAVLIDTAGRYTTQDSHQESDNKSWLSFLSLLKTNRPRQPINGVILAISLEDIMKLDGQELGAHATAIRKRLLDMHRELKVDFPVYALFTKADLVAGFSEYFGNFAESRRRKVWGATFRTQDRTKNLVGEVPGEFDALARRLTEEVPDRLQEEPDPVARIAIFDFPAQFGCLKQPVTEFLNRIFEPNRYQANANLRGFYFSSGTQEGTPIDQVLGAIGRSAGGMAAARHLSGSGRSYFLHDLLTKVIFAEAGWVSFDRAAVRRARVLRFGSMAAIALAGALLLGAWGWSFATNKALINATETAADEYRVNGAEQLAATTISDNDLHTVLGLLDTLRDLPAGYARRATATPIGETFGLSQRDRLEASSQESYRQALERMFRSRLILRLERQIETNLNDPIAVYEALKVYLMLGGKAPKVDDELIVAWMRQDWEQNLYPGPNNRGGREALEAHLRAMLDLDLAHRPSFELNGPLVESAQRSIARMKMADRAYALIKSASRSAILEDFSVAARAGPDAALVFETVDGSDLDKLVIPGFYTYAGFNDFFLSQLAAVAEKLDSEQWVLGESGKQAAIEEQFSNLGPTLLDEYAEDFVRVWSDVLDNLKLRPLAADRPQYVALSAASSPASPIKLLFSAIRDETALTRERDGGEQAPDVAGLPGGEIAGELTKVAAQRAADRVGGLARIGIDLAMRKSQSRAGAVFGSGSQARMIPGASIEAQFKPYHVLVEGEAGARPIDKLVENFYEIYRSLVLAANNPSQAEQAGANLQMQVVNLRTNTSRLPPALARMAQAAIDDFEADAAGNSIAQLNQMLASTVTRACQRVIANRYPFSRRSDRDVPMSDFARLFAPDGILDRFFNQNLAPLVDMSGATWTWKQDTRMGRDLSKAALREFQRATEIRDAFFAQGGPMPRVSLSVAHLSLNGGAAMALLNINGQVIQTQHVGSAPQTIDWPGSMGAGTVSVSLTPELPGRVSSAAFNGPWALMRFLDSGSVTRSGDDIRARFVIGGRDVAYTMRVGTIANPFFLPALAEFSCPTGL